MDGMKEKTLFRSIALLVGIALALGVFALFLAVYH
jgi:hypothetical protein